MNVKHCATCGADLVEGASFCTSCGAPVKIEPSSHCSSCGVDLVEGASFCTSCGAAVQATGPRARPPAPEVVAARPPVEAEAPVHAARLNIPYPQRLSRWLIFVKWVLAIPHLAVLYLYMVAAWFAAIAAWFAILFTGSLPRGLFDFIAGYDRWWLRFLAYVLLLTDEYPPFTNSPGRHPVEFEVDYPIAHSRGLIFVKWLLAVPHMVLLAFYAFAVIMVSPVAWFAILFTATYPRPLFNFVAGYLRWLARMMAYSSSPGAWTLYNPYVGGLLTDEYPPFSNR